LILPPGWARDKDYDESTGLGAYANMEYNQKYIVERFHSQGQCATKLLYQNMRATSRQLSLKLGDVYTDTVTLADGTDAVKYTFPLMLQQSPVLRVEYVLIPFGDGCYGMIYMSPEEVATQKRKTIDSLYTSFDPLGGMIEGVSRREALILQSRDPDAKQLDPALQTGDSQGLVGQLFSGLVRLSPTMQIEPDLAESWKVSEDGKVYTFMLRPDLHFASGKPLTAEDVRFSWERAASKSLESTTAATYLGDIVGVKEMQEGKADHLEGVKVIDDLTLQVTLDAAKPYFLAKLTYPTSYVVDSENVQDDPEKWVYEPNESGPFELDRYEQEETIVLASNSHYHTPPTLKHIVYLLNRSGSPLSFFQAGEADLIGLSNDDAKAVLDPSHPLNRNLQSGVAMSTVSVHFNNSLPPMDDPNVRKALSLAIDLDELHDNLYQNMHVPAKSLLPPGMPGYSDEFPVHQFDPEAAKAALAASRYAKEMPTLVLTKAGQAGSKNPVVDALVAQWKKNLGISVRVENLDPQKFSEEVVEKHGHMVLSGWNADYPDPQNFLDVLYRTGSEFNFSGYSNPEVDKLLDQAGVELDTTRRLELYHQTEQLLMDDYAALPLVHWKEYMLVSSDVQGWQVLPLSVPLFQALWLER